jgi:hypothetical protein
MGGNDEVCKVKISALRGTRISLTLPLLLASPVFTLSSLPVLEECRALPPASPGLTLTIQTLNSKAPPCCASGTATTWENSSPTPG